jgi:hypothetical protein
LVPPLSPRLDASVLSPLSERYCIDGELRYPEWLKGKWRVRSTVTGYTMPIGERFIDEFTRVLAREDVDTRLQLTYELSFVGVAPPAGASALSVAQEKLDNAVAETDAFLSVDGPRVVGGRYEIDRDHPHGRTVLTVRSADRDGGFVLDQRVVWAASEAPSSAVFITSELVVQTGTNAGATEPSDVSYYEILTRFERSSRGGGVRARYRLAQYLTLPGVRAVGPGVRDDEEGRQLRALAKLANGRAVSFFDCEWTMERQRSQVKSGTVERLALRLDSKRARGAGGEHFVTYG